VHSIENANGGGPTRKTIESVTQGCAPGTSAGTDSAQQIPSDEKLWGPGQSKCQLWVIPPSSSLFSAMGLSSIE